MDFIRSELNKMGIPYNSLSLLQDKDGVMVARIKNTTHSYIIKCFLNEEFKREIMNYRILSSLGIPTIQILAATDSSILLEDIACSSVYRLGMKDDLNNPTVAKCIAIWYKQLHKQGYDYAALHGEGLYDEADFFTLENINEIKEKTNTQKAPAWEMLEQNFATINQILRSTRKTLTYNDFYYTNLIVAKDFSSAMMFDYNLLGKGYVYADLRNVVSALSPKAKNAFLSEYGTFDSLETAIDDVVCPIITLHLACQRKHFPNWAMSCIDDINTTFGLKIQYLLTMN